MANPTDDWAPKKRHPLETKNFFSALLEDLEEVFDNWSSADIERLRAEDETAFNQRPT